MDIAPEAYAAATRRGQTKVAEYGATSVQYDPGMGMVRVSLRTDKELRFYPDAIEELAKATEAQLANVELTTGGLGLYFPDLDVDLTIPNLIHSEDGRRIVVIKLPE